MLRSYLKVALRNILKHKFYSVLNIAGLALGLIPCLLIGLYIYDELSFDNFHKDYQNIYHIGLHVNFGGQEYKVATSPPPLATAMMAGIPGVERATRLMESSNVIVKYEDKSFSEKKLLYADSNFFDFFGFKLLQGDEKTVLSEPNTTVLTASIAIKYFGNESPIGKIMLIGKNGGAFKVTGVVKQPPANSHIQFDMLLSAVSDKVMRGDGWDGLDVFTYYRKNPSTLLSSIETKLKNIVRKNVAPKLENQLGESFEAFEKKGGIYTFFSYPLSESHLYHPEIVGHIMPPGDISYVRILGAVGLFILLIACINFMNLSTARSASRAKEVGLRKTLGSVRSKLIVQFLSESFLYVFAAMTIAAMGVYFLLPEFNLLSGKELSFNVINATPIMMSTAIIFIAVALLAGSYPAFYLTHFNPIDVLKGNIKSGMKSKGIRSILVVVQFTLSIALVICTMVVHNQLHFMQRKNVGLDKQNVLIVENTNTLGNNRSAFLKAVSDQTAVVKAGYASGVFLNSISSFRAEGTNKDILLPDMFTDYNYLDVLKISLLQGRYFAREFPSDTLACVVNEAAVKELGWTDAINQKLIYNKMNLRVIGVVKDFNFESMRSKIKPIVIRLARESSHMIVRYNGNPGDAVALLESLWKQYIVNEPYEYAFLDQSFDKLFREEQRLGELFTVMSSIAIFIACLGLLGLASFTAEQRTKEIGIRKVMGASVGSINGMLSKEFMKLVGIAFIIAAALAWYLMDGWLKTFAFKEELGPVVFLLSGLMAAGIAWLTVSYHFIKAARSNPTDALRSE